MAELFLLTYIILLDVGLMIRDSFFCKHGGSNTGVSVCCPRYFSTLDLNLNLGCNQREVGIRKKIENMGYNNLGLQQWLNLDIFY